MDSLSNQLLCTRFFNEYHVFDNMPPSIEYNDIFPFMGYCRGCEIAADIEASNFTTGYTIIWKRAIVDFKIDWPKLKKRESYSKCLLSKLVISIKEKYNLIRDRIPLLILLYELFLVSEFKEFYKTVMMVDAYNMACEIMETPKYKHICSDGGKAIQSVICSFELLYLWETKHCVLKVYKKLTKLLNLDVAKFIFNLWATNSAICIQKRISLLF